MGMPAEGFGGAPAPDGGGGAPSSFEHRGGYAPPGGPPTPPSPPQQPPQQQPPQGGSQTPQQPTNPYDAYMQGMPALQRQLVDPALAAFKPQFDQVYNELQAYKQAGIDPQTAAQAAQIWQLLEDDPQTLYNLLKAEFEPQQMQQPPVQPQQPPYTSASYYGQQPGGYPPHIWSQPQVQPQFDQWGHPVVPQGFGQPQPYQQQPQPGQYGQPPLDPNLARFMETQQQQQQMLGAMGQYLVAQHQQQRQAQEDAALNNALTDARQRLGDFNEEFVLLQLEKGKTIDDAVAAWRGVLQQQANAAGQPGSNVTPFPTPPVLSGGGVPNQQTNVKDLSKSDTKALVAQILTQQS